jgi:hypothetical protein
MRRSRHHLPCTHHTPSARVARACCAPVWLDVFGVHKGVSQQVSRALQPLHAHGLDDELPLRQLNLCACVVRRSASVGWRQTHALFTVACVHTTKPTRALRAHRVLVVHDLLHERLLLWWRRVQRVVGSQVAQATHT